jgi:DUF971 family protein
MSALRPTNIIADRNERVLRISWNDGHESVYPFGGLRAICPCVACKGGHELMGELPDPRLVRDTHDDALTLERIEPVGSYALQFLWSDGHSTGIYTWPFLRAACPCVNCLGSG